MASPKTYVRKQAGLYAIVAQARPSRTVAGEKIPLDGRFGVAADDVAIQVIEVCHETWDCVYPRYSVIGFERYGKRPGKLKPPLTTMRSATGTGGVRGVRSFPNMRPSRRPPITTS